MCPVGTCSNRGGRKSLQREELQGVELQHESDGALFQASQESQGQGKREGNRTLRLIIVL
jgi:hypothetical protein